MVSSRSRARARSLSALMAPTIARSARKVVRDSDRSKPDTTTGLKKKARSAPTKSVPWEFTPEVVEVCDGSLTKSNSAVGGRKNVQTRRISTVSEGPADAESSWEVPRSRTGSVRSVQDSLGSRVPSLAGSVCAGENVGRSRESSMSRSRLSTKSRRADEKVRSVQDSLGSRVPSRAGSVCAGENVGRSRESSMSRSRAPARRANEKHRPESTVSRSTSVCSGKSSQRSRSRRRGSVSSPSGSTRASSRRTSVSRAPASPFATDIYPETDLGRGRTRNLNSVYSIQEEKSESNFSRARPTRPKNYHHRPRNPDPSDVPTHVLWTRLKSAQETASRLRSSLDISQHREANLRSSLVSKTALCAQLQSELAHLREDHTSQYDQISRSADGEIRKIQANSRRKERQLELELYAERLAWKVERDTLKNVIQEQEEEKRRGSVREENAEKEDLVRLVMYVKNERELQAIKQKKKIQEERWGTVVNTFHENIRESQLQVQGILGKMKLVNVI